MNVYKKSILDRKGETVTVAGTKYHRVLEGHEYDPTSKRSAPKYSMVRLGN